MAHGIEYLKRAEAASLGITYESLLAAVLKAGGAIDKSCQYSSVFIFQLKGNN
jgi:hypothetical protein